MNTNKLQAEFKKLKYLKGDDWVTIIALVIAAISVAVYMDKVRGRVIEVLGRAASNIITEAEEVARKAQEVEA